MYFDVTFGQQCNNPANLKTLRCWDLNMCLYAKSTKIKQVKLMRLWDTQIMFAPILWVFILWFINYYIQCPVIFPIIGPVVSSYFCSIVSMLMANFVFVSSISHCCQDGPQIDTE